ncbi:glycosyl hydrolase family 95 catalytic domain-containing protein [Paenibacillus sp. TAB 01]|uniref:glycosyl hydrolase family 95 catalytic domain-containing protein n=1 Tax=Paenibacillus sp. TAB 01 TaxID=3368988 RepID=UPI003753693E
MEKKTGGNGLELNLNWSEFLARHDMTWTTRPLTWDEGALIGNGLMGAMMYGEEHRLKRNVLRLVLGRTDITAKRPTGGYSPRVPIGEIDLECEGWIYQPTTIRIDLWNAEIRAHIVTTKGEIRLRAFIHSEKPVLVIELEPDEGELGAQLRWYAEPEVDPVLKNADGINLNQYIPQIKVTRSAAGEVQVGVQRYDLGDGCTTAWQEGALGGNRRFCYLTVQQGADAPAAAAAVQLIEAAVNEGPEALLQSHRSWWHAYYPQSFVSLPDTRLEGFYWIQMYKLASATRKEHQIIDNQGPWMAPTPWPGVWFNMNVQMSYSPVYTSNRLELGESLIRALDANRHNLIANVPEAYREDSAGLGRSCSYDLQSRVEDETGNLLWICHNYWRHYRHAMDETMLREGLRPLLRRAVQYHVHLLEEGEDGRLHLPPTVSPEYGSFKRMTVADCHYDLALLRWGCKTMLRIDNRLGLNDPLSEKWREVLERLVPYPEDENGLLLGKDAAIEFGHRHFSHLLAVFPLHVLTGEQAEERELIHKSLRYWTGMEGDMRGFTFTGAASIAAAIGLGDEALQYIRSFLHLIKPNTMYREAGPVMESPLACAEAIQDLLLQSWGDKIRVFPALPQEWKDVAFHDLRAEGAFLISAVRSGGRTSYIRVKSLAGEPCRLQTDWSLGDGEQVCAASEAPVTVSGLGGGLYELGLKQGEEVILYLSDLSGGSGNVRLENEEVGGPFTMGPVAAQRHLCNYFGANKPWRLYGIPFGMNG